MAERIKEKVFCRRGSSLLMAGLLGNTLRLMKEAAGLPSAASPAEIRAPISITSEGLDLFLAASPCDHQKMASGLIAGWLPDVWCQGQPAEPRVRASVGRSSSGAAFEESDDLSCL